MIFLAVGAIVGVGLFYTGFRVGRQAKWEDGIGAPPQPIIKSKAEEEKPQEQSLDEEG
jgi:hypothetical protein